jgi:hypothetical protein
MSTDVGSGAVDHDLDVVKSVRRCRAHEGPKDLLDLLGQLAVSLASSSTGRLCLGYSPFCSGALKEEAVVPSWPY